jgi:hypothetical protein
MIFFLSIFLYIIPLGERLLSDISKRQIVSLAIDVGEMGQQTVTLDKNTDLFTQFFSIFTNLQYLKFLSTSIWHQKLRFDRSSLTVFSSSLLELHVNLHYFNDCLYLLDERFNQLRTLYVNIFAIMTPRLIIKNKVNHFM